MFGTRSIAQRMHLGASPSSALHPIRAELPDQRSPTTWGGASQPRGSAMRCHGPLTFGVSAIISIDGHRVSCFRCLPAQTHLPRKGSETQKRTPRDAPFIKSMAAFSGSATRPPPRQHAKKKPGGFFFFFPRGGGPGGEGGEPTGGGLPLAAWPPAGLPLQRRLHRGTAAGGQAPPRTNGATTAAAATNSGAFSGRQDVPGRQMRQELAFMAFSISLARCISSGADQCNRRHHRHQAAKPIRPMR